MHTPTPLLLTQPDPSRIHRRLTQAGFTCHHLPLLGITPMPIHTPLLEDEIKQVQAVIVASPAAANWLCSHYPSSPNWKTDLTWFTPGSGTAEILAHWGVDAQYPSSQHNAAAMLQLIPSTVASLLWIGRRSSAVSRLQRSHHCPIRNIISHTVQPTHYDCEHLSGYAQHRWLISSAQALLHAHKLWKQCALQPQLVVTSQRLHGLATRLGYTCMSAESAKPDHVLDALDIPKSRGTD